MKNDKLITVIICLYNKEKWIGDTIQSVLKQTYSNFELIIVNDGSTDRSLQIASSFNDSRINIYSIPNGGLPHARNYGINKSNGEYIAFLDADDSYMPYHLEQLVNLFEKNENLNVACDLYTSNKDFTEEKEIKITVIHNILDYFSSSKFPFHLCSTLIKKTLIDKNNLFFEEKMTIGEDLNFILKLNQFTSFYLLNRIGLYYNRDDENGMMNKLTSVRLFPKYFKNVNSKDYSDIQKKQKNKFLKNEYYKIAYQNKAIPFSRKEFKENILNSHMSIISILIYLSIRLFPIAIINKLKKYKPY
jgi:glycosyltransferase involved in cell wall biosynthesis